MNEPFEGLRFNARRPTSLRGLLPIGVGIAMFVLAWQVVPDNILFWLLLVSVAGLTWAASYGGRQVLAVVHDLIHRLEQM